MNLKTEFEKEARENKDALIMAVIGVDHRADFGSPERKLFPLREVESWVSASSKLDYDFHDDEDCHAAIAWGEKYVYFTYFYHNEVLVDFVPRNPQRCTIDSGGVSIGRVKAVDADVETIQDYPAESFAPDIAKVVRVDADIEASYLRDENLANQSAMILGAVNPPINTPTDEEVDAHLDAVLKACGSALRYYSMQKTLDEMRAAMRAAMRHGEDS